MRTFGHARTAQHGFGSDQSAVEASECCSISHVNVNRRIYFEFIEYISASHHIFGRLFLKVDKKFPETLSEERFEFAMIDRLKSFPINFSGKLSLSKQILST